MLLNLNIWSLFIKRAQATTQLSSSTLSATLLPFLAASLLLLSLGCRFTVIAMWAGGLVERGLSAGLLQGSPTELGAPAGVRTIISDMWLPLGRWLASHVWLKWLAIVGTSARQCVFSKQDCNEERKTERKHA